MFEREPLPADSRLWTHPAVYVSPHNASVSTPEAIAAFVAGQIEGTTAASRSAISSTGDAGIEAGARRAPAGLRLTQRDAIGSFLLLCFRRVDPQICFRLATQPEDLRILKIKVVVHDAEEGGYWAEVPAISGCATQGDTMEELLGNLREAIEGCLSVDVAAPEGGQRGPGPGNCCMS